MLTLLDREAARGMVLLLWCAGTLMAADTRPPNRFSVGPSFALNLRADFTQLGGGSPELAPGFYDDGYNLPDISGSQDGTTWNWGYQRPDQYQDDTIRLSRSSSPANGSAPNASNDPQYGFELAYARELVPWGSTRWGIEAAFGFTAIAIRDTRALAGDVVQVTDSFGLDGVIPPLAPYYGSFDGPGPLLGTVPSNQTRLQSGAASLTGQRTLDADLFAWRLGPYFEWLVAPPLSLQLGGGLAVAYLTSRFAYSETVFLPELDPVERSGSRSSDGWLVGGYLETRVSVAVSGRVSVFTGVQYQNLGEFTQETDGKRARLDLRQGFFVHGGASFHF
jgi:hypothetical protein